MLGVAVEHHFGNFVLDAAFDSAGGLTALFGRSGAGKTSLINAIAGLLRPERARIVVDGAVLTDTEHGVFVATRRRRIGYVFQEGRLFPHLSVRQNLDYGRRMSGQPRNADELGRIAALLDIEHLLDRRPGKLSGGERQRVAVGRALLMRPRLLLLAEPLASLDTGHKREILPYLVRLRDDAGIPLVYVTHMPAEVRRIATTVVRLDNGRVAATRGVGP